MKITLIRSCGFLLPIILTGCFDSSNNLSEGGSNNNIATAKTTIQVTANSLNTETVTLTNSGDVAVSGFMMPQIPTDLAPMLEVDLADSTCATATFPLQPGSECSYVFKTLDAAANAPAATSGDITIPAVYSNSTLSSLVLATTVTHYLFAANAQGVSAWDGNTWTNLSGPSAVTSLLSVSNANGLDAAAIYAGRNSGTAGQDVYKWNGLTWSTVTGSGTAPDNVYALAFHSLNNTDNQIFAGSSGNTASANNVNFFTDGTWASVGTNPPDAVRALVKSTPSSGSLYAGSATGTSGQDVSVYDGTTWSALGTNGPTNVYALAFNSSLNQLYAGSTGNTSNASSVNIYNLGNNSWTQAGSGAPVAVSALALDPSGHLYTGSQGNYNWTDQNNAGSQDWRSITSSSDGSHLAAVVYAGDIWTSSNYGETWIQHTLGNLQRWTSITSSSNGRYLAATDGTNGIIWTSSDYGETWIQHISALQSWFSISSSANGSHLAAAAFYGDIWTSSNYGEDWTDQTSSGSLGWYSITSSADGSHLAAVVYGGDIYTSSDDGVSWTDQTSAGSRYWNSITSSADGSHLAATAYGEDIWTSADGGANWTDQTGSGSRSWYSITSSADGSHLAAVAADGIWTSNDYGLTWTGQNNSVSANWFSITSSSDGTKLATGISGGDIYTGNQMDIHTFNNNTWQALQGNQGTPPINIDALVLDSDSNVYAGSQGNGSSGDVNWYNQSNSNWLPLNSTGAPSHVTALTLGTQLTIIANS